MPRASATWIRLAILTAVVTGGASRTETCGSAAAAEPANECTAEILASEPDAGADEPEIEPIRFYPICSKHYACCMDTRMRLIPDAPNKSRCASCEDLCNTDEQRGQWPYNTPSGGDCVYWAARYRDRRWDPDCDRLPR